MEGGSGAWPRGGSQGSVAGKQWWGVRHSGEVIVGIFAANRAILTEQDNAVELQPEENCHKRTQRRGAATKTPAMGSIVKRVGKQFLIKCSSLCFLLSLCLFAADFWIVSSGGAPAERPGLTCYPYNQKAYTLSFSNPEERAETNL
jgi:hypothetical protein